MSSRTPKLTPNNVRTINGTPGINWNIYKNRQFQLIQRQNYQRWRQGTARTRGSPNNENMTIPLIKRNNGLVVPMEVFIPTGKSFVNNGAQKMFTINGRPSNSFVNAMREGMNYRPAIVNGMQNPNAPFGEGFYSTKYNIRMLAKLAKAQLTNSNSNSNIGSELYPGNVQYQGLEELNHLNPVFRANSNPNNSNSNNNTMATIAMHSGATQTPVVNAAMQERKRKRQEGLQKNIKTLRREVSNRRRSPNYNSNAQYRQALNEINTLLQNVSTQVNNPPNGNINNQAIRQQLDAMVQTLVAMNNRISAQKRKRNEAVLKAERRRTLQQSNAKYNANKGMQGPRHSSSVGTWTETVNNRMGVCAKLKQIRKLLNDMIGRRCVKANNNNNITNMYNGSINNTNKNMLLRIQKMMRELNNEHQHRTRNLNSLNSP